jgi:heme-degrading monooxygenase HmoA
MHLAEFNLSVWKIDDTSEAAKGFLDKVGQVNALAERADGFVWRLLDEGRDEKGRTPFGGPDTLVTLSLWESVEALEQFVWKTVHKRVLDRKGEWFEKLERHHMVLWWVPEGHRPTLEEAKERLDHRQAHGDTDYAFGWPKQSQMAAE